MLFTDNKIVISITGINTLRFINLLKQNNIRLFNIKRMSDTTECVMFAKDFKKIKSLAKITGVRVRISKKNGPGFFIFNNRNRYFLVAGLIIFIIIILWSIQKIVKIEIRGNEYYASTEIYEFLTENNIDYGSAVKNISCKDIEKLMLNHFDLLTFVSVHINGNTLIITVKENKTVKQEKEDETPCNLVATEDGVVVSIITRAGVPLVKAGDEVKREDVLVYSKIDYNKIMGENYGYETVCSDADILIRVNKEYKDIVNRKYEKRVYTGRIQKVKGIKINNLYLTISKEKCKFKKYDTETTYSDDRYGFKKMPVTYFYTTYREYELVESEYTDEELQNILEKKIDNYIEKLKENSIQTESKSVNIRLYSESAVAEGTITTVEPAFKKEQFIVDECD
ncbi:MAG: sporulation protein YqfD [Butyrivibrio crossotus]|nr:sporulation protein YqfD [Butyrivibrio crossotus]MDY4027742.1 sporulation protein YqfD [Butyrivibrio crossotus]